MPNTGDKARENKRKFRHDAQEELKEVRDQLDDLQHEKREKERKLDKVRRELKHSLEYSSFSKAPVRANFREEVKGSRFHSKAQLDMSSPGAMSPIGIRPKGI